MIDLTTSYLGLELNNPLVAAASPLSKKLDTMRCLEDAGIGAIVMYSLFEEQIIHESSTRDHYQSHGSESYGEALGYFPDLGAYNLHPEEYLELIQQAKSAVRIPIIGSVNGVSPGKWTDYAHKIEQAGADALELNTYYIPTDVTHTAQEIEKAYIELVREIRRQIHIPLSVKISPFYTALPSFTNRLVQFGANGLVLFNRFYQPDLDIETLEVTPDLDLSQSTDIRLPLRWVAILYGKIKADLALSSGVHSAEDVVKSVMAGAKVAMMASELIAHGPGRAATIIEELERWMEKYEYDSVSQMLGIMSQQSVTNPAAFERASYMKVLSSVCGNLEQK